MSEWRLFEQGAVPHVSTYEFFAGQPRAPHLEQAVHEGRLHKAAEMLLRARAMGASTFSDLGCGDGGLLQLVQGEFDAAWGYDLQPSNVPGWKERGVSATWMDVFSAESRKHVRYGVVSAATEVLEHVADPHGTLAFLRGQSRYLVASSPFRENDQSHCPEHCWAWDCAGYAAMITGAGWQILEHEQVDDVFQVVLASA